MSDSWIRSKLHSVVNKDTLFRFENKYSPMIKFKSKNGWFTYIILPGCTNFKRISPLAKLHFPIRRMQTPATRKMEHNVPTSSRRRCCCCCYFTNLAFLRTFELPYFPEHYFVHPVECESTASCTSWEATCPRPSPIIVYCASLHRPSCS